MKRSAPKAPAKKAAKGKAKPSPRKPVKKATPQAGASAKARWSTASTPGKAPVVRKAPMGSFGLLMTSEPARMKPIKLAAERPSSYDALSALGRVVEVIGKAGTSSVLGVSKAQPGRWLSGEEGMSPRYQTAIKELDGFLNLVLNAFTPEQATIWLFSPNSFLGSATPMDVFRLKGLTAVAPAISGFQQGAYA